MSRRQAPFAANETPNIAVGPQYDTTHVYVAAADVDRFVASDLATFGGTASKPAVITVTPTPSRTMWQATAEVPLTADHNAVVQKLRLSEGKGGDSPSIYQSLENLVTHWPAGPTNARREVLLLSSGIDGLSVNKFDPANDPYLESALDKAQKAGIVVYSIYDGSSRFGGSLAGQSSQSKLIEVSGDTGGDTFMEGTLTPISIGGYLNALDGRFASQYVLTFTTEASKHKEGELSEIQVRLEQHDLKPYYAHRVLVPRD